jgi:membrane protein YdbS with pleckstrin-like domain
LNGTVLRSFPYSRRSFTFNMALIGAIVPAAVVLMLAVGVDILYLGAIAALAIAVFVVLGLSPLLTEHEVLDHYLVLRQGWYFRGTIPIDQITRIERLSKGPSRTGVFFRLLTSTLFVTSRRTDLIELELKSKRKFSWALGKRADRVVFDVLDTDALIRTLHAEGSFPPVDSQRP